MDTMTIKALRETVASRRPFKLFMADGRSVEVPHPEFVAMEPGERLLYVHSGEKTETIDLLLVVSMEETKPLPLGS
jgi:hypothetical protein